MICLTRTQEVDQHGNVIPAENGSPEWGPLTGTGAELPNGNGVETNGKPSDLERNLNSEESIHRTAVTQDISLHNLNDHA
jgi:amidophosphoribosyltransferase